jgi:hypothetical protein
VGAVGASLPVVVVLGITVTVHLTNQQYTDVQIERIEIAAPQSIKCTVTVISTVTVIP